MLAALRKEGALIRFVSDDALNGRLETVVDADRALTCANSRRRSGFQSSSKVLATTCGVASFAPVAAAVPGSIGTCSS
ncbi:MAG: hypothetical protein WKF94_09840 [Solirubrobacteraceae bacterium]